MRHRLRLETAGEHAALEARCDGLIVAKPGGLRRFVALHHVAFAMFPPTGPGLISAPILADLSARAEADLRDFGPLPKAAPLGLHPLAIDYVLCGSMHGMAVLRKRHADQIAREGLSFFDAPDYRPLWACFRAEVNRIDPASECADMVVRDARRVFALYADLAEQLQTSAACSKMEVPA